MERRMLLAIVLSFIAVMGYSAITGRGCMAPPPNKPAEENGEQPRDEQPKNGEMPQPNGDKPEPNGDEPAPDQPKDPVDPTSHPQGKVAATTATLESDELRVRFSSRGGAIDFVTLKNVRESGKEHAFDVILPVDPLMAMGAVDDTGTSPDEAPGGRDRRNMAAGPMRSLNWTQVAGKDGEVVYTFETPDGLTYTKRWSLAEGKDRFDIRLAISVSPKDRKAREPVRLKLLAASGQIRETVEGAFATPNSVMYRLSSSGDIVGPALWGLPEEKLQLKGRSKERLRVLGTRSAYFMVALFSSASKNEAPITRFWATGEDASERENMEERLEAFFRDERGRNLDQDKRLDRRLVTGLRNMSHAWVTLDLPVGAEPAELRFYAGPVDRGTIRGNDDYGSIKPILTYPNAFDFVADALLWIYDLWLKLFGSEGLAVILMTLVVRGAMIPISVKNQLSMRKYGRKVAKLKPKVKALQERYASNPKKLREEQMKLYREHGVGFPTGCLMMLIQIPIFFALFSSLRVEYSIRGAEFLWISDLSGPDKLIDFGTRLFDIGILYVESLNILPLIMVALSVLHMRNMPPPADEQQAQQMKMMKWLPIIFAVILYNYTAALAIYMVLSSAIAIVESKIVRAKDDEPPATESVFQKAAT